MENAITIDCRPAGAAAALAAGAWAAPALAVHERRLATALGVRRRLDSMFGVALTFDDGPHPQATPKILEILRDARAPATFFLVGECVRDTGSLAAEITAAGHEIAVHGDRHRNTLRLTPAAQHQDLRRCEATIIDATGRAPTRTRPPYGVMSAGAWWAARRRSLEVVLWSRWGRDWRAAATAASITDELTCGLSGGDILLLHDSDRYAAPRSWADTVAALPRILERIGDRALHVVPL